MQLLQVFLEYEYANTIMLVGGLILSVIGFVQVVRKGLALVLWAVLFAVGLFPVVYVFKGSNVDFLAAARDRVNDIGSLVPGIGDDVLSVWCDKLDQAGK